MRVLWIAPIPHPRVSAEVHPAPWIASLSHELIKRKNIHLSIIAWSSKVENIIDEFQWDSIRYILLKEPNYYLDIISLFTLRIKRLNNVLKDKIKEFDIIHIHGIEHQYELSLKGINKPYVISIQGILSKCFPFMPYTHPKTKLVMLLGSLYEKKYLSKFNNFSCRTKWDSNFVSKKNSNANIFMINEMLREEFYNYEMKEKGDNILFLGGSNPMKGIKEVLIVFNIVKKQNNNIKLIVLGNCQQKRIARIIKKYNLTNINMENIQFRGIVNAVGVIKAMRDSFCLLHPTYIDNSPNSVCEAQCIGLPVIAADVGGVSSLIKNLKTGIFTNLNINNIVANVFELYNNDVLWEKLNKNSISVSRKRHDKSIIVNDTINMYKTLLGS